MNTQTVRFVDKCGIPIGVAEVIDKGTHFGGHIDLAATSPETRAVFDEFEEIVIGQMFSFLDEIEDRIAALGVTAVFPNGHEVPVRDLQICPSNGSISFKVDVAWPAPAANGSSIKVRDNSGQVIGEFRPS
jgi:hypothetical protein